MAIIDIKSFLESGGTQTDPSIVLSQVQTDLAAQGVNVKAGTSTGVTNPRGSRRGNANYSADPAENARIENAIRERARQQAIKEAAQRAAEKKAAAQREATQQEATRRKADSLTASRLREAGLKSAEAKALITRKAIQEMAKERGRAFTSREVRILLGGNKGVQSLRDATRRLKASGSSITKQIRSIIKERYSDLTKKEQKEILENVISKNPSFISAEEQPKGFLEKLKKKLDDERRKLRTKKLRGEKLTPIQETKLFGKTALSSVVGTGEAFISLGKALIQPKDIINSAKKIIKNPKNIIALPKNLAKSIKKGSVKFGKLLKVSPSEALAQVGTEIVLLKGTGKALKVTGKITTKGKTILSPKFTRIKNNALVVPSKVKGKKVTIKLVAKTKQVPRAKGFLGKKKIVIAKKFPKIPIKQQISLEGKKIIAVSGQADKLLGIIKRQKIIRKPIPDEALLKPSTKKLLSKFDEGKINKRDLIKLDKRLRLETKGQGSILERSFFADPNARLRVSRLGQQNNDASLLDILSGDITFKTPKPQVLLFENVRVEKLPKNLKSIGLKLKKGKTLTEAETNKLVKFQLKKSGKFKPLGKISKEPEVTIAPNEIIKREKTVGVTLINGQRVPIVRARIVKPKPATKKLIKKVKSGKATKKEIKLLEKKLKKETGFKTNLRRRAKGRKRVSLRRIGGSIASRLIKKVKRVKRTKRPKKRSITRPRQIPKRPKLIKRITPKRIRPTRRISPKPIPRVTPTRPRPKPRPRPIPRIKIPVRIKFKKHKTIKKQKTIEKLGFNIFVKSKKRFIKVNKRPLSKAKAKDRGVYITDNTTANTFKVVPIGKVKELGKLTKGEAGKFARSQNKFRGFKLKRKRKIGLTNKYIEKKGRPRIDKKGEKQGLTLNKFLKQKGIIKSPKRKKKTITRVRKKFTKK